MISLIIDHIEFEQTKGEKRIEKKEVDLNPPPTLHVVNHSKHTKKNKHEKKKSSYVITKATELELLNESTLKNTKLMDCLDKAWLTKLWYFSCIKKKNVGHFCLLLHLVSVNAR